MTKQKPLRIIGKAVGVIAFLAVWFVMLRYSNWYFYNGFYEKNAIMRYCSQFNNVELGWFAYIFKHGVLNFAAGYGAIFPLLVPVIYLVQIFRKKTFAKTVGILIKLFFTALIYVVLIIGLLYGALYLMEQLPLVAGFLLIVGIGMIVPTCKTLYVVVIVDD